MCRERYRRVTISLFFLLDIPSVFKCWVQLERIDILEMMHLKQWNWEKLTCPINKCWWPCFKKNSIPLEVFFFSGIERESFLWLYILSPREKCWPVMSLGFYMRVFLKLIWLMIRFYDSRFSFYWNLSCYCARENVERKILKLQLSIISLMEYGWLFRELWGRMLCVVNFVRTATKRESNVCHWKYTSSMSWRP